MEIVNCEVALGGDKRNTVPKTGVSVAEVAVLRAVHGSDAVFNIEPAGRADISHAAEKERLYSYYKARDEDNKLVVAQVFPGASARLIDTVAELGLPEELFKPIARAKAVAPAAAKKSAKKEDPPAGDDASTGNPLE